MTAPSLKRDDVKDGRDIEVLDRERKVAAVREEDKPTAPKLLFVRSPQTPTSCA